MRRWPRTSPATSTRCARGPGPAVRAVGPAPPPPPPRPERYRHRRRRQHSAGQRRPQRHQLRRRRPGASGADTTQAWEAIERAIIGKAVDLLSGPGGLASFLRRRQLGVRLGGLSLPLDIGYSETIPAGIRSAVTLRTSTAGGPRVQPARQCVRSAPCQAQGQRRQDQHQRLRAPVPVPPPGRDPPVGLDPGPEPRRHHHRVEPRQDQGPAQPRPARPPRVSPLGPLITAGRAAGSQTRAPDDARQANEARGVIRCCRGVGVHVKTAGNQDHL